MCQGKMKFCNNVREVSGNFTFQTDEARMFGPNVGGLGRGSGGGWWGREWSNVAKVSCILRHWGVQLILTYSWARPAILIAGKGREGVFLAHLS